MKTLNEIEEKVLSACKEAAKEGDTGVEFCFDEVSWYLNVEINDKQLRGYIGQLIKKGYISTIKGGYFDLELLQ